MQHLGPQKNKLWLAKADPNFIGYTYKNWEAVQPSDGGELGVESALLWPFLGSHARAHVCIHMHTRTHTYKNWEMVQPSDGGELGVESKWLGHF